MITVRCPACAKIVGFDESDGGALVACPHCREPFFVPAVARPVVPVDTAAAPAVAPPSAPPLPRAPALPDEIRVADEPDVAQYDEVLPVEEEPPPEPPIEIEVVSETDVMPQLELDTPPPPPPPPEPSGTPAEVKPTDLAPTLAAAETLADALPEPEKPIDVLDEVDEEEKERDRPRRSKSKKRRDSDRDEPKRSAKAATPARIMGGAGMFLGGLILLGTLLHHLIGGGSAWHWGACCGDVFALALIGVGLFFAIRG